MAINVPWGVIYLSIAAILYLQPQYAIFNSSLATFTILSTIITSFRVLYSVFLYPEFLTPIKSIPSPKVRSWLTGNTDSYLLETSFEDQIEWCRTIPNNGLLRYYIVGNQERVLLTNPKALSELLVQKAYDFPKPEMTRLILAPITGEHGVLLVEGDEHKKQRKNLLPAFSYRHVKDLYPVFWSKSIEMVKRIEDDIRNRADPTDNVVQIRNWASRATLDIIGIAGMDKDFDSLRDPNNELTKQYEKLLKIPPFAERMIFVICLLVTNFKVAQSLPLKRRREVKESSHVIRGAARQVIRLKKEKMEKNASDNGIDIISVALESGAFTEDELIDQIMTFLGAGHETTATALQWSVYVLSKHQDVQTRLREEIRSNLPSISAENPEPLSAATLDSLPYLHAFCNEVFRFHPSVPGTTRTADRDTTLVGYPIPKGTRLMVSPEVINHSKELWGPDADQFNPERWLGPGRANTGGASSNYSFLTFLHGPRSCIGQGFAKAELACLVAAFVGKFHMELQDPNKKLEVRRGATVSPKDGVLAKLTLLEGW